MLEHRRPEVSRFSGNFPEFAQREQLNITMPADLDQFRRENSHGAVVGGKGLVQLRHDPADGGALFQ
jgi:hypothetical protein